LNERGGDILGETKMESPYTPQEREKLNQLHELWKNADDAVTKRQRAMWRKQVLTIERAAHKRETAPSDGGTPKPTLEEFDGDEDAYQEALELWRIGQDERLAHAVLDNAGSTFTARENANRTLRRCQKRRQEIEPLANDDSRLRDDDGIPVPAPNQHDERPWAERFPYQDLQKSRFVTSDEARQHHKNLCACIDEFERIGKMSPEQQKSFWDKQESDRITRMEQQNLEDQESSAPKFNPRSIKTPLELETWKRQSEHFARLRGEIVDVPQLQTIEQPRRHVAFQLSDGFLFWGDNSACPTPLPAGTTIHRASNPPNYRSDENEKRIPAGWRYDFLNFMWVRTQ
jgi:hypothetical protein